MNVSLTSELEGLVHDLLNKGLYGNQSEVVRAGLRLLHEKEQEKEARLLSLRNDVRIGLQQVLNGEVDVLSAEDFKKRGRERLKIQG